jgi:hypothetical protein
MPLCAVRGALSLDVRRQMNLSDRKLTLTQEKIFRAAARVVFGFWVVGGALGCLMSALTGELAGAALAAVVAVVGVKGWRLAGRPLQESYASLGRRRERLEAWVNGTGRGSDKENQ